MTTDTMPKTAQVEVEIGGTTVRVGGMCKGSGMIHPNMATMLAYITTDAAVERRPDVQRCVKPSPTAASTRSPSTATAPPTTAS